VPVQALRNTSITFVTKGFRMIVNVPVHAVAARVVDRQWFCI